MRQKGGQQAAIPVESVDVGEVQRVRCGTWSQRNRFRLDFLTNDRVDLGADVDSTSLAAVAWPWTSESKTRISEMPRRPATSRISKPAGLVTRREPASDDVGKKGQPSEPGHADRDDTWLCLSLRNNRYDPQLCRDLFRCARATTCARR